MSDPSGHKTSERDVTARPRVSVITVVRNAKAVIAQTIESVLSQPCGSLEYIVIDGGSSDGTVDVVRNYRDRLAYFISEPDKGIYDAMNKGLEQAHGEGHLFLNAGDHFVGTVLTDGLTIPSHVPVFKKNAFGWLGRVGPKDHRQGLPYCHQGIIFETKGIRFDTKLRFAADYLYYLDHGYARLPESHVPGHVYYDNAGLSAVNSGTRDRELAGIIKERFGPFWHALFVAKCGIKDAVRPFFRR